MLVRAGADVCEGASPFLREYAGRHVHAPAGKGQEQTQDVTPVALMLLCRGDGRVAAHTALPNRIADFGLAMWLFRDGQVGEEQEIDQGVDQLLGQGPCIFVFHHGRLGLFVIGAIEYDLCGDGRIPGAFAPLSPEKALLPRVQGFLLVDVGQHARQDADTVERISLGGELGVGEGRVMPKNEEAGSHGKYQRFEVLERLVAGPAHVGRRKETEDVLRGLGQLPELRDTVSTVDTDGRLSTSGACCMHHPALGTHSRGDVQRSSSCRQRGCVAPRTAERCPF